LGTCNISKEVIYFKFSSHVSLLINESIHNLLKHSKICIVSYSATIIQLTNEISN